jgi:hypothetical protein
MSVVLLASSLPAPTPGDVSAYLRQAGWRPHQPEPKWAVFELLKETKTLTLEVPLLADAGDYKTCIEDLLRNLEIVEKRSAVEILRDIYATTKDVVRLVVKGIQTDPGRVNVVAGLGLHYAVRDLLLAAACAAIEPRAVYVKKKPDKAMEHLQRARFGPSEIGSYVITIETPVAPWLQGPLDPSLDLDPPFERRVGITLSRALLAVKLAAQETDAGGSLEPFTKRVREGVSANLCEAVSSVFEATSATTADFHLAFATSRPAARELPRQVGFLATTSPLLREVARALRAETQWDGIEIEGSIFKLESGDVSQGGLAHVLCQVEGQNRRIRIPLPASSYQSAVTAHADGHVIRCIGEMAREGQSYVLRNPREFSVVQDDTP